MHAKASAPILRMRAHVAKSAQVTIVFLQPCRVTVNQPSESVPTVAGGPLSAFGRIASPGGSAARQDGFTGGAAKPVLLQEIVERPADQRLRRGALLQRQRLERKGNSRIEMAADPDGFLPRGLPRCRRSRAGRRRRRALTISRRDGIVWFQRRCDSGWRSGHGAGA